MFSVLLLVRLQSPSKLGSWRRCSSLRRVLSSGQSAVIVDFLSRRCVCRLIHGGNFVTLRYITPPKAPSFTLGPVSLPHIPYLQKDGNGQPQCGFTPPTPPSSMPSVFFKLIVTENTKTRVLQQIFVLRLNSIG